MGKSKNLSADLKKRMVDLHKPRRKSLEAISKQQISRSSVQSIICIPYVSHSAERILVQMVRNPETTKLQACHELGAAGTSVSLSTVKQILNCYGLNGCLSRKKPLLQNQHQQAWLMFAAVHMDKENLPTEEFLWQDETRIELFGNNEQWHMGGGVKLKHSTSRTLYQLLSTVVGTSYSDAILLRYTVELVHCPKWKE